MKDWWKSKTLWVNLIAVGTIIVRAECGLILTPAGEVAVLAAINLVLRMVTKEELNW
ncbi:hypothetical protein KAX02_01545 [candidate division WOR-3 bacterium]|nr:hypothetical protein [candidate division WOR-3 bacterium]